MLGYGLLAVVLPLVAFVGVVPLVVVFGDRLLDRTDAGGGEVDDPLAELRGRYARGELPDGAFERAVERALAAEDAPARAGVEVAETTAADREREREAERRSARPRDRLERGPSGFTHVLADGTKAGPAGFRRPSKPTRAARPNGRP